MIPGPNFIIILPLALFRVLLIYGNVVKLFTSITGGSKPLMLPLKRFCVGWRNKKT